MWSVCVMWCSNNQTSNDIDKIDTKYNTHIIDNILTMQVPKIVLFVCYQIARFAGVAVE